MGLMESSMPYVGCHGQFFGRCPRFSIALGSIRRPQDSTEGNPKIPCPPRRVEVYRDPIAMRATAEDHVTLTSCPSEPPPIALPAPIESPVRPNSPGIRRT